MFVGCTNECSCILHGRTFAQYCPSPEQGVYLVKSDPWWCGRIRDGRRPFVLRLKYNQTAVIRRDIAFRGKP